MDLTVGPVSDNSISSTKPVHCDIDKLVDEIKELNDEFADHLHSIIKFRSRCEKLIEKLRELKANDLEVDDDIRRQVSVVRNVVQDSTVGDQLDSMLKIMLRLVSDVPPVFP